VIERGDKVAKRIEREETEREIEIERKRERERERQKEREREGKVVRSSTDEQQLS
jgi:hypothetical protein